MDESGSYDMFDGDAKIGEADIAILDAFDPSGYPGCPSEWNGKTVLEIEGFGVFGDGEDLHGRGYGRLGLQKCYELAQKLSEGRMVVHATWGAGSFYEHCGFKGMNKGREGIKYFEPNPETLQLLFLTPPRKIEQTFQLKKRPKEDFEFNMDEFLSNLQESGTKKKEEKTDQKLKSSPVIFFNRGGNGGL